MIGPTPFVFDLNHLISLAQNNESAYRSAQPFSHIVLDNFLPEEVANKALGYFPEVNSPAFINRSMEEQPGKYGSVNGYQLTHLHPWMQQFLLAFNSYSMLYFLERLTGIRQLISDPYFYGGGLHQIVDKGHLDIHTDFNLQKDIGLFRRINVLFYLNKGWDPSYGGQLELWKQNPKECASSIEPIYNRCVIFNTEKHSLHGHPTPLNLPEGKTRKSIALYYYTRNPAPNDELPRETMWNKG